MPSPFKSLFFSAILAASTAALLVAGFQFEVGENTGWRKPTGKEPPTFNEWATQNRFHIGDTLHFKYQNDSVLVVTAADYLNCNTSNPISKFEDGDTIFQFDAPGFFYFISGLPDHCESGQKLIIRVMHPSAAEAPAPLAGHGDWPGPAAVNSTTKFSVVSYFVTALAGLFVVFYMFM
ncbi:hypothetical protein ACS0TY_032512 [Phlomoides rotata]